MLCIILGLLTWSSVLKRRMSLQASCSLQRCSSVFGCTTLGSESSSSSSGLNASAHTEGKTCTVDLCTTLNEVFILGLWQQTIYTGSAGVRNLYHKDKNWTRHQTNTHFSHDMHVPSMILSYLIETLSWNCSYSAADPQNSMRFKKKIEGSNWPQVKSKRSQMIEFRAHVAEQTWHSSSQDKVFSNHRKRSFVSE